MNKNKINDPLEVFYVDAECGSGKTTAAMEYILNHPGLYLFSLPKTELIDEIRASFERTKPSTSSVHSKAIHSKCCTKTVAATISETMESWSQTVDHGVIFITHEALAVVDWWRPGLNSEKWHLIHDECPEPWEYHESNHPVSYNQALYYIKPKDIEPENLVIDPSLGDYYTSLELTKSGSRLLNTPRDSCHKEWKPRLTIPNLYDIVYAERRFFEEKYDPDCDKDKKLVILGLTNYRNFNAFASVTFMSANFLESNLYRVWNKVRVKFSAHPGIHTSRKRVHDRNRRIEIYYFANRDASKNWFGDPCDPLGAINEWISNNISTEFYYATNSGNENKITSQHGRNIGPKATGSNDLSDFDTAFWLCAMKPKPMEYHIIGSIFNMTGNELDAGYEHHYMYQFFSRSNIRDFGSDKPVRFYVVSKRQAEYLKKVFGLSDDNVKWVGYYIPSVTRKKSDTPPKKRGPKPKYGTEKERQEARKKTSRESKRRLRAKAKALASAKNASPSSADK